jgi:hypothetical protein
MTVIQGAPTNTNDNDDKSELVRASQAYQRIEQITGFKPVIIFNTDGGYLAVAMFGEAETALWGETEVEALEALAQRLEGSRVTTGATPRLEGR